VLAEVQLMKSQNKPVKYFTIIKSKEIILIETKDVEMEDEVKEFRNEL